MSYESALGAPKVHAAFNQARGIAISKSTVNKYLYPAEEFR